MVAMNPDHITTINLGTVVSRRSDETFRIPWTKTEIT
jgi:hypothetical protein